MTSFKIVSDGKVTTVTDAKTGRPIENMTSLEVFQVPPGPMLAVVKIIGTVAEMSAEASGAVEKNAEK